MLINIQKKHFYFLISILAVIGVGFVIAQTGQYNPGHDVDSISGAQVRVFGSCASPSTPGLVMVGVLETGGVVCEPDDVGTGGGGGISCGQVPGCESDPQVGAITNGKWCRGSGSLINCDQDAPTADEIDPTVLASVKDGVSWGEVSNIPLGFSDGVDNVGAASLDCVTESFSKTSGIISQECGDGNSAYSSYTAISSATQCNSGAIQFTAPYANGFQSKCTSGSIDLHLRCCTVT